jgi:hypothetical protein
LPFVKTVYSNFIAIEISIVEWDDVKDAVAEQISFVDKWRNYYYTIDETKVKKQPITVYGESHPTISNFVVVEC